MRTTAPDHGLKIFSTCPPSALAQPRTCIRQLQEIARWSENAGCEGILVFTDNAQLDPWLVSQVIIEATERLCPLAAIQPVYLHSYSVAKMITSLAHLYGRRIREYAGERWWRSAEGARARCSTRRPRTRGSCSSSIRATKAVLHEASLPVASSCR